MLIRTELRRSAPALLTLAAFVLAPIMLGCESPEAEPTATEQLREGLTFYASFDGSAEADLAPGDPAVYHAPSWDRRTEDAPGLPGDTLVRHADGHFGDALEFVKSSPGIVFFRAEENMPYREQDWSGTVSFWLSLTPDEDLEPGYVDPLQISPTGWNDAALFVDFTQDDVPRKFRFAAFADYDVWNPDSLDWSEIAVDERPMIELSEPPFDRDRWTHVVMTFEGFNSGSADGLVTGYLDGELQGTLGGRDQTFTWDLDDTIIAIGLDYVGRFDELALFDRALTAEEVQALYELEGGLSTIL